MNWVIILAKENKNDKKLMLIKVVSNSKYK